MINFNNKTFRAIHTEGSADVTDETVFEYQQEGSVVSATYAGGLVLFGHLIGLVNDEGALDIRYHHVNFMGTLMTGVCFTLPEMQENGKIRLHEKWRWTSGDFSEGESILEEV